MKVLFFDSLFPKGHKKLNSKYITLLLDIGYQLFICGKSDWYIYDERACYIDNEQWTNDEGKGYGKVKGRLRNLKNYFLVAKEIKKYKPDIIYIASYDVTTLCIALPILFKHRKRIIIQEHNNVDHLDNCIKRIFYNIYKNLFFHFVFEDFISERLIELGVKSKLIITIPHPILSQPERKNDSCEKQYILGLSNSNSEDIVSTFIKEQRQNRIFSELKYKIILKSKMHRYEDEALVVNNGWISDETYEEYCRKAAFFVIPFSKYGYKYRVSAVFLEAVANDVFVVSSRFPLSEFYSRKYPGICSIFDAPVDLVSLVNSNSYEKYKIARKQFINDHSDEKIVRLLKETFEYIINI